MIDLPYTLVSEGSSDRVLIPVLDWLLAQYNIFSSQSDDDKWLDLRKLTRPPKNLSDRINTALDLTYPDPKLLFVHKDADNKGYEIRKHQILDVLEKVKDRPPAVCVIPVQEQEAWLLFNESAIRWVARKPKGRIKLNLPALKNLEKTSKPKEKLHQALRDASELKGRRMHKFNVDIEKHRLVQYLAETEGFAILRNLSAFSALEADIQSIIAEQGWITE